MTSTTGQTIYENLLSLDVDNNPVSAATFDAIAMLNGIEYTGVTVNMSLSDATRGLFSASWSSDTIGSYQIYVKNNVTNAIFLSDIVKILPDGGLYPTIYIGL